MENNIFGGCEWLTFPECEAALTRTRFSLSDVKSASLCITALGYFEAYLNGTAVSSDKLIPAMSDYEKRDLTGIHMPICDELSHRIYYLRYDVSSLVNEGENILAAHIGAGWYGQTKSLNEGMPYWGDNLLVFRLSVTHGDGSTEEIFSSRANTRWKKSYILETQLYFGENHDLRKYENGWLRPDFEGSFEPVPAVRKPPEALLCETDFPTDKVIRSIEPKVIYSFGDTRIYDLGTYAAGYAVIRFNGSAWTNDIATVRYADELREDGSLHFHYCGSEARIQRDQFLYDESCEQKELYPHFTWHAGRYIELTGRADVLRFDVVQSDIKQISTFESDNETLNWIFNAYVLTQSTNIHGCVPSDCPHRERLGYTGDGQLTCGAVMSVFDGRELYRKWIRDILDCQDKKGGHVQHTAPFYGGGGGPGGWGGAICIVPYEYYLAYGDKETLLSAYDGMKAYISYMLSHSENGLVVREEEGGWCLGDWCPPHNDVKIPERFVNTYFLIRCLDIVSEVARLSGREDESRFYAEKASEERQLFQNAFFDETTGSFCGGIQGADAFALDIGLGDERTVQNLAGKYREKPEIDTGIFGTDLVVKQLFEHGYADTAFDLLTNESENSFYNMKSHGALTLWENWDGCDSRCHPMFGAVVRYFFTCVLGIRRKDGKAGTNEFTVSPAKIRRLRSVKGTLGTPDGSITVEINTDANGERKITVSTTGHVKGMLL